MSSRRSRPARSQSRSPEPPPAEISAIIPTTPAPEDMRVAQDRAETPPDELAAVDAAWDEILAS
jgi:hypothetical protein